VGDVIPAMESKNLADLYDLPMLDWEPIAARLERGMTQAPGAGGPDRHTCWLATIDADGSPHVTGVGGSWHDDAWWFVTAETSRKGRNLARDPRCTISVATDEFDVIVNGTAEKITDPATVADMVARAVADGWPARVDDSAIAITADFSAPSAGPPPWHVYRVTPVRAVALGVTEPGGATRWDF